MQATVNSPALRLQFARRDYMVRSEKRRSSSPQRSPEHGYDRPPRRRRSHAGFFYKLLMVILLLTLWPVGLILLWRRRVDWTVLSKLFTSIVSLMACILLIGFALTVDTGNARYTAIQDRANSFLDSAADSLIDFSVHMAERAEISFEAVGEIRDLYQTEGLNRAADAIDWGVDLAQKARSGVSGFFANLSAGEEPEEAAEPGDEPTGEPDETSPTDEPEVELPAVDGGATGAPDEAESGEAEVAGEEPTPAPESAEAAEITVGEETQELPVYIPGAFPEAESGAPVVSGVLHRSGELEVGALPTPTPEPEPEELDFDVKPAGEATVYFNIGSGKYYHMAPVCGSMKNADTHTLAEAAENIHTPCERCTPPDKALVQELYIVWTDEDGVAHLSDECAAFQGQWNILSAAEANEQGLTGCANCGADRYLAALRDGLAVTVNGTSPETAPEAEAEAAPEADATPTPEPTPEPTLEITPEPSPQLVTPRATLKPASRAIVYHSTNGRFYHTNDHCSGMTGGSPYSLAQCVSDGYKRCNACNAPDPEALDQICLWEDEQGVCHVSDECEYFEGQYTLIERNEALNQNLVGCTQCGANDYLVPFTEISPYQSLGEDDVL